jgi:hypothetical protein
MMPIAFREPASPTSRPGIGNCKYVIRAANEVAERVGILGGVACTVAAKTSPQLTATAKSIGVPFDLSTMISFYWSSFVAYGPVRFAPHLWGLSNRSVDDA